MNLATSRRIPCTWSGRRSRIPIYSFSAALNGLAGPLHGLANQECLGWLMDVHKKFGGVPYRDELYKFAWDTLNSGKVIPGYGHAVLRVPDPRFTAQMEFAKKRFPEDELVRLADMVFDVVPAGAEGAGQGEEPGPERGCDQRHAAVLLRRARIRLLHRVVRGRPRPGRDRQLRVGARPRQPLERPKSLTTKMLEDVVAKAAQPANPA